jgi:Ser/Thr protein kinase RdoA (MazF antagonist)
VTPAAVLDAWSLAGARVTAVDGGLINSTFIAAGRDRTLVLQRVHPVFAPAVHDDIEAVTAHVVAAGLETPRLVRTRDGALYANAGGEVWRALTFLDGVTVHKCAGPAWAEAGFSAIAAFHRAVADLDHEFRFVRAGVHDTAAHLAKLRAVGDAAGPLGRDILAAAGELPPLPALPRRVTHGDLKISNVLFHAGAPPRARCLIDLDTVGRQSMAYELGDALRSWCNPAGEDVDAPAIDGAVFAAAIRGYASAGARILSRVEIDALVPGAETVCIELAARFCVDAVEDRYFGWDPARFASRREHNLVRARGQLALGLSVRSARAELSGMLTPLR